ncbi:MAG TPA: error-prone DNA polymerase [Vicinamibacterales bacterium]|nr:error-prone DNA polymerase [Vicinamibacterales bacterium]
MYVELHAASAFSFLDGASLPEALVERAASLGYSTLALLDRDGVYGAPRFHLAAQRAGLKAIIGAELTISGTRDAGCGMRLPVLVESREGYRNLCRLVTRMKLRSPKGEGALSLEDLDGQTGGLVALVGRAALGGRRFGVGGLVDRLVGLFGAANMRIELQRHLLRDEEADNAALRDLAAAFHVPLIATNGVRFAEASARPLYDVLTCIRHKTTLERAGRRLSCNAERYLKSPEAMARLFADIPEALRGTGELAERLEYTMADLGYRFPEYPVPPGETMASFLRKITQAGARDRYRPYDDRARRQIERELNLIEKLDLAGYFLIVWDIVNFCRQQDILAQGRGSAANSAVCYSLGITAVDPIGMELLFERFLSEERGEWPDIDLDLPSGDRRERVIQHVYEKYGKFGAAMTANMITYRGRSAAREVGKVLSIEPAQIDRLAKVMNHFEFVDPKDTLERNLRDVGVDGHQPVVQTFGRLWEEIQNLPRHLGQHSGGMVLCQGRLDEIVPLENASMPGRVVIQWDKDDCADMGLIKVDLLGLGMMAVIQDALHLVNDNRDAGCGMRDAPGLDLAHLPPDDPAVYRMLQEPDTIGIFQVESRAQMATLPRLKPTTFYDIVVEVAIIRPGPIVGNMVHPYLKRRQGKELVTYPHPSLEPILKRTLGVPLFQEQLLRIAMVAAGFSGGEAEELRRAFGFKRSQHRMQQIEGKLRAGMETQGITGPPAEAIITSITSFALYGFPESHSASFALLVYASAYLKAHYPAAFYTAMLNNQPMGFYHPATLVKDAQRHGVRFAPIDVQSSGWECRVDVDGQVRLGFMYVNGLRADTGRAIAARGTGLAASNRCPKCGCEDRSMIEHTPETTCFCNVCAHEWGAAPPAPSPQSRYASIEDLIARTGVRRDELATLAEIGALNALGYDRRSAQWQIERAVRPAGRLFDEQGPVASRGPQAPSPLRPMSPPERLMADYSGTSLTIGPHPLALRRQELALRGVVRAIELARGRHGRRVRVAGAVITRQRPGTAKGFVFLTLEDETGIANIIVRPDLFTDERRTIIGEPYLLVEGILQIQDGVTSVKAERVVSLAGGGPEPQSHDFR